MNVKYYVLATKIQVTFYVLHIHNKLSFFSWQLVKMTT